MQKDFIKFDKLAKFRQIWLHWRPHTIWLRQLVHRTLTVGKDVMQTSKTGDQLYSPYGECY